MVFLCCMANFMFMILPRVLYPGKYVKINQISCNKANCDEVTNQPKPIIQFEPEKQVNQDLENDEFYHIKNTREHDDMVNQKYCNGPRCKFLLAYYPPSIDASTTDIEYLTYIKLAESLGRTLVLVNVGLTRISSCQRFPFDFHYDVEKLQENYPNVKFISQRDFQKWSYQRILSPSTSHYYLTHGASENSINFLTPYSHSLKKVWCLDKFKLNLNDDVTTFKQLRASWNFWKVKGGRDIFKNFLINNLQDNSEVLLIRHDIREPIFNGKLPSLPYAKHIRDAVSNITNSLRPYAAIQWDIRHIKNENLPICAKRLVSKTKDLMNNTQIENIYFSSNYPLSHLNEIINSSKLHYISELHTNTMEFISKEIPYHTADSLGVMKYSDDENLIESSGIRNILDKLVCVEADWLIGSPKWPCNSNNPVDFKRSKVLVSMRNRHWKNLDRSNESGISKIITNF